MKLIRLTTTDPKSLFDNTFNEDIIISGNSKIALQSLSLETINDVIDINPTNNSINFQVQNGFLVTATLTNATYDKDTFLNLFTDIKNALNTATGYTQGLQEISKNLGLEWNVSTNNQKKVTIEYKLGRMGAYEDDFNLDANVGFSTSLTRRILAPLNPVSTTSNDNSALFNDFVSRGCGFIRCRTHDFDDAGVSHLENGYIIGLSKTDLTTIQPTDLTNAMINYGVLVSKNVANDMKYHTILDGVFTASLTNPQFLADGNAANDFQEVIKNYGNIDINIYQGGSAIPINIATHPYTAGEELYPFVIFRGSNCVPNLLRITPSPFGTLTQTTTIETALFAPPRPIYTPTLNFIQLSSDLSNFLNYLHPRNPEQGTLSAVQAEYIAEKAFEPVDIADAFLVELLNLKIDSYDGFKNQRKNLLAVIPKSNSNGELIYEPNTPFFIDLNNNKEIYLRNIKIRVVKPDYSDVNIQGIGTMVLLIDEK